MSDEQPKDSSAPPSGAMPVEQADQPIVSPTPQGAEPDSIGVIHRTATPVPQAFQVKAAAAIAVMKTATISTAVSATTHTTGVASTTDATGPDYTQVVALDDDIYDSDESSGSEDSASITSEDLDFPYPEDDRLRNNVDYTTLDVDDMLAVYSHGPELQEKLDRGDQKFLQYLSHPQRFSQLLRCLVAPQITTEAYQSKAEILPTLAAYVLISPTNQLLIQRLLDSVEDLDYFFDVFVKHGDPKAAWSRVFITLAARQGAVVGLSSYLNGRGLGTEGRGPAVFHSIISAGRLACDPFLQCLVAMTNPETTAFPWGDNLPKCHFVESITSRLQTLQQLGEKEFTFERQIEVANIMDLSHFILTKNCSSLLAGQLQQKNFVAILIRCIFGDLKTPCQIATYAVDLVTKLLQPITNDMGYLANSYPPIVECLISSSGAASPALTPLNATTQFLANPAIGPVLKAKLIKCIEMLLQTNYGRVHDALFQSDVFTAILDAMFALPKASIVHSAGREVICDLLYCEKQEWTDEWLRKSKLVDRLCELAVVEEIPAVARDPANGDALGAPAPTKKVVWLGSIELRPHLILISEKLKSVAALAPTIQQYLNEHPKFHKFYDDVAEYYIEQYKELGNVAVLRAGAGVFDARSFG